MKLHFRGENPSNNRRFGRLRVEGLSCDRGAIIDLSIRGMRLQSHRAWSLKDLRPVTIRSADSRITLPGRCVWVRREGFLRWSVGLAFDEATPEQLRIVGEMALIHAARFDLRAAA